MTATCGAPGSSSIRMPPSFLPFQQQIVGPFKLHCRPASADFFQSLHHRQRPRANERPAGAVPGVKRHSTRKRQAVARRRNPRPPVPAASRRLCFGDHHRTGGRTRFGTFQQHVIGRIAAGQKGNIETARLIFQCP